MNDDLCEELSIHPHQVRAARERLRTAQDGEMARLFSVLGDPTRQRMLAALGDGELCVCDLALATGINRTTVSHQLRILRENHLVKHRRDGRVLFRIGRRAVSPVRSACPVVDRAAPRAAGAAVSPREAGRSAAAHLRRNASGHP